MASVLAQDLATMVAAETTLRWEPLAARVEGEIAEHDVAWSVYRPGDVDRFRTDVAAMANGGGGFLLVGVRTRDGVAVPRRHGPLPLRVGVQDVAAWIAHALGAGMTPRVDVARWYVPATPGTGVTVLRIPAAADLPVAVARGRGWALPFRQGRRMIHHTPWDALGAIRGRDAGIASGVA